jgi:hypothetical protein
LDQNVVFSKKIGENHYHYIVYRSEALLADTVNVAANGSVEKIVAGVPDDASEGTRLIHHSFFIIHHSLFIIHHRLSDHFILCEGI